MVCGQVLSGEYMGKDGQPYCEKGPYNLHKSLGTLNFNRPFFF